MRLDLFLKKTCVLAQRTAAREACDAGAVHVNGLPAKASHALRAGDRVALHLARRELEICVLEIPAGNVAKRDAGRYVQVLRDELRPANDFL